MKYAVVPVLLAAMMVSGCSKDQNTASLTDDVTLNPTPYIPPQCYTNPVSEGGVQNPCYVCHTPSKRPNLLNDIDVQLEYFFPETGLENRWSNIFRDRSAEVAKISDDEILKYVRTDNYIAADGEPELAHQLKNTPKEWDRNGNGRWDGYTPDVYFNFDEQGFDLTPEGKDSGWRVYAYYPFPGTFMPTNGSMDDVMIRLPEAFRETAGGEYSRDIYRLNLAVVEAMMKEQDIAIPVTDEASLGVDLDKNGELSIASSLRYEWAPREGKQMYYVGRAGVLQAEGKVHIAARLFPEGTEFVHSVRYMNVVDGDVTMAPRMKELRYARKGEWRNYFQLRTIVDKEVKERHDFPDRTKVAFGNMEEGMSTPHGWVYQGFIEDSSGALRPQTYEETYFCLGCHGYTGASNDTNLSFTRKFGDHSFRGGWYHWSDKGLAGVADPLREDGHGEYAYYLQNNPTGNEYRDNKEVFNKFHQGDGTARQEMFQALSEDISVLLIPSAERALTLNKTYREIVREQSFNKGRDAIIRDPGTLHEKVELSQKTGITEVLSYY